MCVVNALIRFLFDAKLIGLAEIFFSIYTHTLLPPPAHTTRKYKGTKEY